MNILFLSELFYPHGGGAELATYLYAELLSKAEFDVIVVTNQFRGEPTFSKNEGFVVYRLPLFETGKSLKYSILSRFDVLMSSFMRKMIKWADVIYIPRFWFSAIPLARIHRKTVVTHIHDYIPICPLVIRFDPTRNEICQRGLPCSINCIYSTERSKNTNLIESLKSTVLNFSFFPFLARLISRSDAIIFTSRAQRNLILEHASFPMTKTHVIYNPFPNLNIVDIEADGFGYFGGSNPGKGFNILCRSMEILNSSSIAVHAANFLRLEHSEAILLRKLGIANYGRLKYSEQEAFYKKIRGVVFPSIVPEPSPYVVVEAILRGRLVVASNIGGVPEQGQGCPGVFFFEAGNYQKLAENMDYVHGLNRAVVIDLGIQNRMTFLRNFSNETTLRKFSLLLDRIA